MPWSQRGGASVTLRRLVEAARRESEPVDRTHRAQEVAFRFQRSPKTINNQRTSVLRKLGLRNTAELTLFAIRSGLLAA